MRNLPFVTMLMLCCLLTVGCGGGGGGGSVGVPLSPAANVVFEAQVPTSALNANVLANMPQSIRASLIPEDIEVTLAGVPLRYVGVSGDALLYRLEFSAENASFSEIIEQGGGVAELMIAIGTKEAVRQQLELNTRTYGESSKNLRITLRITNQIRNGTYGVEILGGPGVGPLGAPGQSNKSLGVTGIDFLASSGEYLALADANDVPVDNTKIKITFDGLVERATNSFRIATLDGITPSLILSQEDLGTAISAEVIEVAETDTYPAHSYILFTLLNSSEAGKALVANTDYTLKFELQTVRRVDDPMVKLRPFVILKRTFKTVSNQ
ncbi:MAG: hypothetical protein ACOYXC_19425 [Candidatus Rifleibacteriota bacterium]